MKPNPKAKVQFAVIATRYTWRILHQDLNGNLWKIDLDRYKNPIPDTPRAVQLWNQARSSWTQLTRPGPLTS